MGDLIEQINDELRAGESGETDAERRRRTRRQLIEAGLIKPTQADIINAFSDWLDGGTTAPKGGFEQFLDSKRGTKREVKSRERSADELAAALEIVGGALDRTGGGGGGGREFRPQTIQLPSERQLFGAAENAALGPAPDLLFREVFEEAFPEFGRKESPFNRFVQQKGGELEKRFMGDVFKQFNEPGFQDLLKQDYESLVRQMERGSFDGAGGSVPAFEDFIKQRISADFRQFLEGEKPKLDKAFELTSPDQRGQRQTGGIAPPKRIL
jgi:hypothetical protein